MKVKTGIPLVALLAATFVAPGAANDAAGPRPAPAAESSTSKAFGTAPPIQPGVLLPEKLPTDLLRSAVLPATFRSAPQRATESSKSSSPPPLRACWQHVYPCFQALRAIMGTVEEHPEQSGHFLIRAARLIALMAVAAGAALVAFRQFRS